MSNCLHLGPILLLPLLLTGSTQLQGPTISPDPLPMIREPTASDEIFNSGASSPTVSFSIVHGGYSDGTVDGGGNIDAAADLSDVFGPDHTLGSTDDDLSPAAGSPAIDGGSHSVLPTDRFDLDGDGDVSEPVPVDAAGNRRSFDGGTGSTVVDIGAYEFHSPMETANEPPIEPHSFYLTQPYPNPAAEILSFEFGVAAASLVRITLSDPLGRLVSVVYDGQAQPGKPYPITIPTESLASGAYFLRLRADGAERSRRFVIAR